MDLLRYYKLTANNEAELVIVTNDEVLAFMHDASHKENLANFIHDRLFYRYINSFNYKSDKKINKINEEHTSDEFQLLFKNGFSLMANSCLLIETLESFYKGWGNTKKLSQRAFLDFFNRDDNFTEFRNDGLPALFFKHIRCGILHQGETTGGWTITRNGRFILDNDNRTIDAAIFSKRLEKSLYDYKEQLLKAEWQSSIWENARKKLKHIRLLYLHVTHYVIAF